MCIMFQVKLQVSNDIENLDREIIDLKRKVRDLRRRYNHLERELDYADEVDKENERP